MPLVTTTMSLPIPQGTFDAFKQQTNWDYSAGYINFGYYVPIVPTQSSAYFLWEINIEPGQTIYSCYIRLHPLQTDQYVQTFNLAWLRGSSLQDLQNEPMDGEWINEIEWNAPAWTEEHLNTYSTAADTSDISSYLQDFIDREDYAPGDLFCVRLTKDSIGQSLRKVETVDPVNDIGNPAVLVITYGEAVSSGTEIDPDYYKLIADHYAQSLDQIVDVSEQYYNAAYEILLVHDFDVELDILPSSHLAYRHSYLLYGNASPSVISAVKSLQLHVLDKARTISDTKYTNINDWLSDHQIRVLPNFAGMSAKVGHVILQANIDYESGGDQFYNESGETI